MLLYLLQRVPSDLQVELFNRFRFSLADQAYSYQGFIHLLRSKADERWKVEADRRVREEVRDDPLLNTRDEGLRTSAVTRYQLAVGALVKAQRLLYSSQLLASQVEFLLSAGIRERLRRFTGDELAGFMRHLHGEELSALRHQLVRCVVLEQAVPTGSNPFLLSNQRVGEQLLEEFGQSDS